MFASIKKFLSQVGLGPDADPGQEWHTGGAGTPPPTGEPDPGRGFAEFTAKAAARIVAVLAQQFDWVVHQPMPQDGRVLASAEVATENQDGTLTELKVGTRVETASGAVVGPRELRGKCGHPGCGEYEADLLRCSECGAARCYLHCRELTVRGEKRILCAEHLEEALKNWDSWAEYDLACGTRARIPTAPPKPLAVTPPATTPEPLIYEPYPTLPKRAAAPVAPVSARRPDQGSRPAR